jgi:hypothetical protein
MLAFGRGTGKVLLMETHTNTAIFTWFENQTTDIYEIHAPNCACIQKKIKNFDIDSSSLHTKQATSGKNVMEQIIEEWKSYEEDFNYCESGDPTQFFKIFPCAKKAGK